MSANFKRLKRRIQTVALLKSMLAALSGGTLAAGVMLLLTTHGIIDEKPLIPCLIAGIAALIISGGVSFLLLRKSDKTLAKLLDTDFKLSERTGTMLEYSANDDAISSLQREDAERALSNVKSSDVKFKRLWIYIITLALGVAVLVSAILLIPPKTPAGPKPESPFSITPLQVRAMEELISYVEESGMTSPYREQVALALTDALAELKLARTVSERDEAVKRATDAILLSTDESSSAVEIINSLYQSDSPQVKFLAAAINCYTYKAGSEWESFSERMGILREALAHPDAKNDGADKVKMASETRSLLSTTAVTVSLGLSRSQISDDDALYVVLLRFAEQSGDEGVHGLASLAVSSENMGYDEIQMHLDATFNSMNVDMFKVIDAQLTNVNVGEYAVTRICELFDCSLPKFERPTKSGDAVEGGGNNAEGEGGGMSGAIGSGTEYGSDELVFDPMTGEYVEYGTIIDRYYSIMYNKIQGDFYTEDEKAALKKYFEILYGGFDEEE